MELKQWVNELRCKPAQELMEEQVNLLIKQYFNDAGDYPVEKFVKSFGETFVYLESNLEMKRGIHSSQLEQNLCQIAREPEEFIKKSKEVEKILLNEIKRQARHYQVFLSYLKA